MIDETLFEKFVKKKNEKRKIVFFLQNNHQPIKSTQISATTAQLLATSAKTSVPTSETTKVPTSATTTVQTSATTTSRKTTPRTTGPKTSVACKYTLWIRNETFIVVSS